MRSPSWHPMLLWLFVIGLGVAFGAGLYEHRIVVPDWLVRDAAGIPHWHADVATRDDTGRRFWAFVSTGPLTLLTLASLVAAWRSRGAWRAWWLGAAFTALGERLFTFGFFIPTLIRLSGMPDAPEAVATAQLWSSLNYGRHALNLVAWLAALKAFAVFHQERGRAI